MAGPSVQAAAGPTWQRLTEGEEPINLNEFKDKHYLDMRIFQIPENGGQDIPTKKGLTIPVHLYFTFRDTLQSVDYALISRGLMDREDLEPGAKRGIDEY